MLHVAITRTIRPGREQELERLTWLLMPVLTRSFARWLRAPRPSSTEGAAKR